MNFRQLRAWVRLFTAQRRYNAALQARDEVVLAALRGGMSAQDVADAGDTSLEEIHQIEADRG